MTHPTSLHGDPEYRDAPVGTRVEQNAGYLEKAPNGRWYPDDSPNFDVAGYGYGDLSATREVLRWGLPPDRPTHIEEDEYADTPVGTELSDGYGRRLRKLGVDQWQLYDADGNTIGRQTHNSDWSDRREVLTWGSSPLDPVQVEAPRLITGVPQYIDAPVGTRACRAREASEGDCYIEKIGPNEWIRVNAGRQHDTIYQDSSWGDERVVLRWGPGEPVASAWVPQVGNQIHEMAQFDALPDGTVIRYNYDRNLDEARTRGEEHRKINGEWRYFGSAVNRRDIRASNMDTFQTTLGCWFVVELPHPFTVGMAVTRDNIDLLPVGTRITRVNLHGGYWEKVRPTTWSEHRAENDAINGSRYTGAQVMDMGSGARTVISLPDETPGVMNLETLAARVAQAKQDVREAIDNCVDTNGHAYARPGGYWLLGLETVPAADAHVPFGSAFGLPVGSLVGTGGTVWRVHAHDEMYPQHHAGPERHMSRDEDVRVLALGEAEPEREWSGYNEFLHATWEMARTMRGWHSWCSAVEDCLESHGLEDPGDSPDQEDEPAELLVGREFTGRLSHVERRLIGRLPAGSVITLANNPAAFFKTASDDWYDSAYSHVDNSVLDCHGITVAYIHQV